MNKPINDTVPTKESAQTNRSRAINIYGGENKINTTKVYYQDNKKNTTHVQKQEEMDVLGKKQPKKSNLKQDTLETLPTEPRNEHLDTQRPLNASFDEEEEKYDDISSTTKPDKSLMKDSNQPLSSQVTQKRRKSPPAPKVKTQRESKSAIEFKKNNPY